MPESTTPLTPEEERLRAFASASPEDIADMVSYESDLIAADVRVVLATLDAARAAAPDGLDVERLARALHEVRIPACQPTLARGGTGMMTEVIWECSAKDHLTAAAALRAALAQSAPEESDRPPHLPLPNFSLMGDIQKGRAARAARIDRLIRRGETLFRENAGPGLDPMARLRAREHASLLDALGALAFDFGAARAAAPDGLREAAQALAARIDSQDTRQVPPEDVS